MKRWVQVMPGIDGYLVTLMPDAVHLAFYPSDEGIAGWLQEVRAESFGMLLERMMADGVFKAPSPPYGPVPTFN